MRLVLMSLVVACATPGLPRPPSPPRTVGLGIDLSGFNLSNGLKVAFVYDPHATEVQVTSRYRVGAIDDPPDQRGVAHLVEHLLYQQVIGDRTVFARLQDISTELNGQTGADATTYYARALPSHLDELLAIEAARMSLRCTSVTEAAFEREREVVVNELRLSTRAKALYADLLAGIYPPDHPYHAPIDTEASVRAITRQQACAFADAHYAPNNAVLVISGNLTPDQVQAALAKSVLTVPKRAITPPRAVEPVAAQARDIAISTTVNRPEVLVTWPLPADGKLRVQMVAAADLVAAAIEGRTHRSTATWVVGDDRAQMIGVSMTLRRDATFDDVVAKIHGAIQAAPSALAEIRPDWLAELTFDKIQQTAILKRYAGLETGSRRDIDFATELLAGRNPSVQLAAELAGLRGLDRDRLAEILRDRLSDSRASIIRVDRKGDVPLGVATTLAAPIHDAGQRRGDVDVSDAHRAITTAPPTPPAPRIRVLPNGMKVVLVPDTSVPTIDVKLVFATGTGDEPADKRGVALATAHGIEWNLRHVNDFLRFAAASVGPIVTVDYDTTTFEAVALGMHIDLVLGGLRRLVRDGKTTQLSQQSLRGHATDSLEEVRVALYGRGHPYVAAGVAHALAHVTRDDDDAFRAAHYTPDNATLVIAGHFDAALTDRWIDYLFADWTGHAIARASPPIAPSPLALARERSSILSAYAIELPATAGTRAQRLVIAAMLDDIVADIRHQLGAGYVEDAMLDETRLGSEYLIAGSIDATRAADAFELIASRIAKLRSDPDEAARAFVHARTRALVHLESAARSASSIADSIAADLALGRPPGSATTTAAEVRALRIDDLGAALAELDLDRAIVMMRGPRDKLDPAFAAIHRTPRYVTPQHDDDDEPTAKPERIVDHDADVLIKPDEPLTGDPASPPRRIALGLAAGYTTGDVDHDGVGGMRVAADIGLHVDADTAVGIELAAGYVSGTYDTGEFVPMLHPISDLPIDASLFARVSAYDRLWGAAFAGLHYDRVKDDGTTTSGAGFGFGLQGGVDLWRMPQGRFGLFGRVDSALASSASFASFSIGVAYHR